MAMQPSFVFTGVAIVSIVALTFVLAATNSLRFFTKTRALIAMSFFSIAFMAAIAAFIIMSSDVSEFEGDPSCRPGSNVSFSGLCHPRYARVVAVGERFGDTVIPNDATTSLFPPFVQSMTFEVEGNQTREFLMEFAPGAVFQSAASGNAITGSALLFKDQVIQFQSSAGTVSTWSHPVERQRAVVYVAFLCAFAAIACAIRMTYAG